jgi:hypothetical protein
MLNELSTMPWRRMGSGGCIDPHFLDLGISWRWVVSFTPRPLYTPGESPLFPLDRRLGGPQSRLTLLGIDLRPLAHPACSQSLYQLRYPGSPHEPHILSNIWRDSSKHYGKVWSK